MVRFLIFFIAFVLMVGSVAVTVAQPASHPFDYDFARELALSKEIDVDNPDPATLRRVFAERRQRMLQSIPEGAAIIFSVERAQERRLEFQVPHSSNHDFIYLTGVEGLDSFDSALLLLPTEDGDRVVLYTSSEPEKICQMTGIDEVEPYNKLEEHLSVALTDYRDWRITQIRRHSVAGALSKKWGRKNKVLYLNYPRFLRLGMLEPTRLAFFEKLERFSPELESRDSSDLLDPIRMLQDSYSLACLLRAIRITGEGIVEGLFRGVRPGLTEKEVMETMDYVYRYRGATLGFPTAVHKYAMTGRRPGRSIPEGFIQFVPRSAANVFEAEDIAHVETGAAVNHYSADVQRSMPVDGTFSPEQKRLYEIALDVQKTVISRVKPGVTWWELHNLAVEMLRDAGGYDQYYTYGIGHFIGMEVHDEGDYEQVLQPGMVLAIEQDVAPPDGPRIAFEDDVMVTETGHEWLTQFIPIEMDEVEAMAAQPSSLEAFIDKAPLSISTGEETVKR